MRRALAGIVPDEILNRRRKAFVARAPLSGISRDWANLVEMTQHMMSSSFGLWTQTVFRMRCRRLGVAKKLNDSA